MKTKISTTEKKVKVSAPKMEAPIYNAKGKEAGTIALPSNIFGLDWNADLVHQVATSMMSTARQPIAHTKDRGEVRGGGKKPWQQKGTGRARHGSSRSPIWVGGGVTHGPNKAKNYERKINTKMKAKALFTILSRKFKDGQIVFVDSISFDKPKTAEALGVLSALSKVKGFENLSTKKENAAFIGLSSKNKITEKSFANIGSIVVDEARNINPLIALNNAFVVFENPKAAIALLTAKIK